MNTKDYGCYEQRARQHSIVAPEGKAALVNRNQSRGIVIKHRNIGKQKEKGNEIGRV
jgi:hypothetical protein